MKRNTPDHWKMDALATKLGICIAQAVGHMEMLFHLTAKQAPHGNIGKMPNTHIAKKCGWEGDPEEFISALVECRWLDFCSQQRLIVHDWHDHCDDATKKSVSRSETPFFRPIPAVTENGGQCPPKSDEICLPSLAKPSLAKPEPGEVVDQKPPEAKFASDDIFQGLPPKLQTEEFKAAWVKWEDYFRKKKDRAFQPIQRSPAWENILTEFKGHPLPETAIHAITKAMAEGWTSIYPPKEPPKAIPFRLPTGEELKRREAETLARLGGPMTDEQREAIKAKRRALA